MISVDQLCSLEFHRDRDRALLIKQNACEGRRVGTLAWEDVTGSPQLHGASILMHEFCQRVWRLLQTYLTSRFFTPSAPLQMQIFRSDILGCMMHAKSHGPPRPYLWFRCGRLAILAQRTALGQTSVVNKLKYFAVKALQALLCSHKCDDILLRLILFTWNIIPAAARLMKTEEVWARWVQVIGHI